MSLPKGTGCGSAARGTYDAAVVDHPDSLRQGGGCPPLGGSDPGRDQWRPSGRSPPGRASSRPSAPAAPYAPIAAQVARSLRVAPETAKDSRDLRAATMISGPQKGDIFCA